MKYVVLFVAAVLLLPVADAVNRHLRTGGNHHRDGGLLDRLLAAKAKHRRKSNDNQ